MAKSKAKSKPKSLLLENLSRKDVSIDDLGVVLASKAIIDIYKYNPYLTEAQVNKSMENGSLSKRLVPNMYGDLLCRIINSPPKPEPISRKIKATKEVVKKNPRSTMNLETVDLEISNDGTLLEADYGFDTASLTMAEKLENNPTVSEQTKSLLLKQAESLNNELGNQQKKPLNNGPQPVEPKNKPVKMNGGIVMSESIEPEPRMSFKREK